MKIRNGFVSNSSTTSFCIVGTYKDGLDWEFEEELYAQGSNLSSYGNEWSGGRYVGLSIHQMKDEETLVQFKERAKIALAEAGIETDVVGIMVEGWRDG